MIIPGEQQAEVIKLWITGEPAKTFVLGRFVEMIAASSGGSMVALFFDCTKDAHQRIERGEFPNPPDWLFSISSFLSLARYWDTERVLDTPLKRNVLLATLKTIVQNLRGGTPTSVEAETAKAALEELKKLRGR